MIVLPENETKIKRWKIKDKKVSGESNKVNKIPRGKDSEFVKEGPATTQYSL